jgi:DNA polymerase-3 subunit delta'
MQFKEIIGQKKIIHDLQQAIQNGRLPHALLLSGKSGYGGLPLAMCVAQYIFCENPGENDSCGLCNSCNKTSKLIHPDLHFTIPAFGEKAISETFLPMFRKLFHENPYMDMADWISAHDAENKQWNISSTECLNIVKKLNMQAYEGKWKVQIIWMAELLVREGNRLLKIIEEPPADTIFILVAENEERVLSTILSRCQTYKIPPLHDNEIFDSLKSKGIEEDEASVITRLAGGNFAEAIRLLENTVGDLDEQFLVWLRTSFRGNAIELSTWVEGFISNNREDQKKFMTYGLNFLHELLLLKMVGKAPRLKEDKKESAIKLNNLLVIDQINEICELLNESIFGIERNANSKLLMLDASIQLKNILKRIKVA